MGKIKITVSAPGLKDVVFNSNAKNNLGRFYGDEIMCFSKTKCSFKNKTQKENDMI